MLNTRYFRKAVSLNGAETVKWVEMSGKEYYHFVTDPRNKGRYFLDMGDVVLECTEAEYKRYKAEDDHSSYMQKQGEGLTIMSLSTIERQTSLDGEGALVDMKQNVEEAAIYNLQKENLCAALRYLPMSDYRLIYDLYFSIPQKSVRQLSAERGIPVMTLQNRKARIIKFLRKILQA